MTYNFQPSTISNLLLADKNLRYRIFKDFTEFDSFAEYYNAKKIAIVLKNKYPESLIEIRRAHHRYIIIPGKRIKWRIRQTY